MATEFAAFDDLDLDFLRLVGPTNRAAAHQTEVAAALRALLDATASNAEKRARSLDPYRASSRALYERSRAVIAELLSATVARVIALGDRPALVIALMTFERTEREWHYWVQMVEEWGAPDIAAWPYATAMLRTGTEIFESFVQDQPTT
jgi:hypothetical protein